MTRIVVSVRPEPPGTEAPDTLRWWLNRSLRCELMDGVVEIITGRERRRRWSVEEKLRIVAETQAVGAQVRAVAVQNGLCESLVYTWRRQAREGVLAPPATPMSMPVRTLEAASSAAVPPGRMIKPQASAAHSASHA